MCIYRLNVGYHSDASLLSDQNELKGHICLFYVALDFLSCLLTSVNSNQKKSSHVCQFLLLIGCMGSRSTPWPTSCSCKLPPASRAQSRPSVRACRPEVEKDSQKEKAGKNYHLKGGDTCILQTFRCPLPTLKTVLFWFRLGQMKTKCKDLLAQP